MELIELRWCVLIAIGMQDGRQLRPFVVYRRIAWVNFGCVQSRRRRYSFLDELVLEG